jgi:pimeloyl-ACP methyl ester carboxylesterase
MTARITILTAPTGPHAIGARNLQLKDSARSELFPNGKSPRQFMLTVWYPATGSGGVAMKYASASWWNDVCIGSEISIGLQDYAMAAEIRGRSTHATLNAPILSGANLPVVLFSPGFGIPRIMETALAEELASHGYVVICIDHVYESMIVETPQGLRYQYKAVVDDWYYRTALITRIGDIVSVLDQLELLPYGISTAIQTSNVALIGHSYGGVAAFSVAFDDPRISSIVSLDSSAGWEFDGSMHGARGLPCNTLSLSLENDPDAGITYPGWGIMMGYPASGTLYDLRVTGAKHYTFTDVAMLTTRPTLVGTVAGPRSVALTRSYVRSFLDTQSKGLPLSPKFTAHDSAWPEVVVH